MEGSTGGGISIGGGIVLQIVLILANAFFAMSEIAVISVSEAKAEALEQEGRKGAKALKKLLHVPARFLATLQVGVTLSGFLGSAFAAENFASVLTDWLLSHGAIIPFHTLNTLMVILVTLIIAFFTLVFGELVPKRIAMQKPIEISLGIAGIITFFSAALRPVVALLTTSTNAVIRLFGMDPNATDETVSEEEIRMMVDMGSRAGIIEEDEQVMISNVFELNNLNAGDVMTHRTDVVALCIHDSDDEIMKTLEESGFSRFPVYDEDMDDIIGILRARDFFINRMKQRSVSVRELLTAPYFVPETVRADTLLSELQRRKVHITVVVDEYGGASGIITMEDLLEEIVGNIYDEYDTAEVEIEPIGEDVFRVAGGVDLGTLGEHFGIDMEDEDVDTVGGLVFKQLGVIPEDGTTPEITVGKLHIQVQEIEDRRVQWTIVTRMPDEQEKGKGDEEADEME